MATLSETGVAPSASPEAALVEILSRLECRRLANGLTVCRVFNRQAPLVTTSLWYRAGARHEPDGLWGAAHFLEHMMFKGTRRYGPGVVDRLTQAAGGDNNAFTSHDATSYTFSFASDRWHSALDFEADRMESLLLDEREVDSERAVIEEEISMYEDDPWDSLELELQSRFYGDHPYGRPVLGTRESLASIDSNRLRSFHRRCYRPGNAVLVVAGDVGEGVYDEVEARFGALDGGAPAGVDDAEGETPPRRGFERFERRSGETSRLLVGLPAPSASHPDYAPLCLAVTVLGRGRASRLHRTLVDEGRLCAAISADVNEMVGSGMTVIAAEAAPGADRARVEAEVWRELETLTVSPIASSDLERARRLLLSDWVFGLERIGQQAVLAGSAVALFGEDHPRRFLDAVRLADADSVVAAARRYLDRQAGAVAGWSLGENGHNGGSEPS